MNSPYQLLHIVEMLFQPFQVNNIKERESRRNCCFPLSHIFLSWLLILTKKKYVVLTLDIQNVWAFQISA